MTRQSTLFHLAFSAILCLGLSACSDETQEQKGSSVDGEKPRTEPLPFRMTSPGTPTLPQASGDLTSDTSRLRAPDGKPAIVAVESGHLVQIYMGDRTGRKETFFKDYGRFQRVADSSVPTKKNNPVPPQNILMISTPTHVGSYQAEHGQGWRAPNRFNEVYVTSGASDSLSISEFSLHQMGAKRLPDTTINGYRTRVYRVDGGHIVHTLWIWRDVALREHFFAPYDDVEYWIEPVSLEVGISLPDSLFAFPKEYVILDREAPPLPSALPPPPVQGQ